MFSMLPEDYRSSEVITRLMSRLSDKHVSSKITTRNPMQLTMCRIIVPALHLLLVAIGVHISRRDVVTLRELLHWYVRHLDCSLFACSNR